MVHTIYYVLCISSFKNQTNRVNDKETIYIRNNFKPHTHDFESEKT